MAEVDNVTEIRPPTLELDFTVAWGGRRKVDMTVDYSEDGRIWGARIYSFVVCEWLPVDLISFGRSYPLKYLQIKQAVAQHIAVAGKVIQAPFGQKKNTDPNGVA